MTFPTRLQAAVPSLTPEQAQAVWDALPGLVPDLVWSRFNRLFCRADVFAGGVRYAVREDVNAPGQYHWYFQGARNDFPYLTVKAAKAAANDHHRAAIMSAFAGE